MAEYPETSLESALIGAGLNANAPARTYTDFAEQLAKNQREQAEMESNLARAKELLSQEKITTRQKTAAESAGYNPELIDTMTPDQAEATLRVILQEKGLPVDEDLITKWKATLPALIKREEIDAFASRYARETTRMGQAFVASQADADSDKRDENNDPLVAGQTYAALYDNGGKVTSYIRSGQEKPDLSLKTSEKDSQFWTNQWKMRIANKVNPYLASGRTAVGVAMQSYVRCFRALETMEKKPVSKQDATNIIMEIGAVYKGGSPDQSAILETSYRTIFTDFQDWAQSWTGKVRNALPEDVRLHLISRIEDLEAQSKKVVSDTLDAAEALNSDVIEHFPDQWKKFTDVIDKQLSTPDKDVVPGIGGEKLPKPKDTDESKPAPSRKVPKYTVED